MSKIKRAKNIYYDRSAKSANYRNRREWMKHDRKHRAWYASYIMRHLILFSHQIFQRPRQVCENHINMKAASIMKVIKEHWCAQSLKRENEKSEHSPEIKYLSIMKSRREPMLRRLTKWSVLGDEKPVSNNIKRTRLSLERCKNIWFSMMIVGDRRKLTLWWKWLWRRNARRGTGRTLVAYDEVIFLRGFDSVNVQGITKENISPTWRRNISFRWNRKCAIKSASS